MSFSNSVPIHQSAGVAILFNDKFEGKIQNIINDNAGRITSISFTLKKQTFQIITLYGPNKAYQRENFFQTLTNYITNTQNTIPGGDFNMAQELRDKMGGTVCNTHLVGSVPLNKLINTQELHDTWRKINPGKTEYTYHRNQSKIHRRLDRIYASQNINITNSSILRYQ